jgi:hypothetical protein
LGGLKNGLARVAYQLVIWDAVKKEPIKPAPRQMIIDADNLK